MAHGDDSERIRQTAWIQVISPQIQKGFRSIEVSIKPLMKTLENEGFPKNRPRQFCKALQKQSFLEEKGLVLEAVEGPESGTSTTVVLRYSLAGTYATVDSEAESPEARADRLVNRIRGLMKDEIAAHGGAEGYLRWVRGEDDEEAA